MLFHYSSPDSEFVKTAAESGQSQQIFIQTLNEFNFQKNEIKPYTLTRFAVLYFDKRYQDSNEKSLVCIHFSF